MSSPERFAGLFGSPEDDPLLQNDPLSGATESTTASVDSTTAKASRVHATDDQRVLLISQPDAANGRLAPLRAALKRGWVLENIRVDDDEPDASSPPIAFCLSRSRE